MESSAIGNVKLFKTIAQEVARHTSPMPSPTHGATEHPLEPRQTSKDTPRQTLGATASGALNSIKNFFANSAPKGPTGGDYLNYSVKGQKSLYQDLGEKGESNPLTRDVIPCHEIRATNSAVTCLTFGQEKSHLYYILLATASKDGSVIIYKCYRTEAEIQMLKDSKEANVKIEEEPTNEGNNTGQVSIHLKLLGHSRAVTSIFFSLLEDQLVTTSIDRSVRFWDVETGDMQKVFTDSSPAMVAAFLPFNPSLVVCSNANSVLRFVNINTGHVTQKLKVGSEVRTLTFDDTGLFCFAGTKNGLVHVLEASDSSTVRFKFKQTITQTSVTCVHFVRGIAPCLLVNCCESAVAIVDCIYGPPNGELKNLRVRNRVKLEHTMLPLGCCHSPLGDGWLISASEDHKVHIHALQNTKSASTKTTTLDYHKAPVMSVGVNEQSTLLASADSHGLLVLWRRFNFSACDKGERTVAKS
eukprot:Selendium_serpulae@DN6166_c0_g1_i2.p1